MKIAVSALNWSFLMSNNMYFALDLAKKSLGDIPVGALIINPLIVIGIITANINTIEICSTILKCFLNIILHQKE